MTETRQCKKCGEVKPITGFDMNGDYTARRYVCRHCRAPNHRAKMNRKTRKRSPEHLKRKHDRISADPVRRMRRSARFALQHAIRTGKITRQPCEVCGATITHGHHDDYSKPLEVRWLCPEHHRQHHEATEKAA